MSKYQPLWEYIMKNKTSHFSLTFDQIKEIIGIEIDHSFLTHKKELIPYGYQVDKISLKEKTVSFHAIP